ncbi:hypothetical protein ES708_27151 [subsurface metagenome]
MIVNNLQLYQRSKSFIWTDKHISKNMLAAHLDLDSDVASRNISTIKKTVEWISSVSKENAKILDISVNFSGVVRRKNIIYWIML